MAEVLLFHHAQGLTSGVVAFADDLRAAGHTVHTPDLYAGRTFETLKAGVAHARELGFDNITEAGVRAAEGLPAELVYAGFSLGVGPAQKLAQTRPGARGALLFYAALGTSGRPGRPRCRSGSTPWPMTPSSTTSGTCPPPRRWCRRPRTRSSISIPATSTCSPTPRWTATMPRPRC